MMTFAKRVLITGLAAAAALLLPAGLGGAQAQQPSITTLSGDSRFAGQFAVPINKSQILRVDQPFVDVLVGNSEIADVMPLTDRTLYILGKKLGSTSLSLHRRNKTLLAVVDLVVTHNVEGLKANIFELFPEERVEVRGVHDSIVLTGAISDAARLNKIVTLAEHFAPGKVSNMMSTRGSQQVMLAVRVAEIRRSAFKEIGINTRIFARAGDATFSLLTRFPTPGSLFDGASFIGTAFNGDYAQILDALERKGVVKTLAEPNLIALSGDTASFLAGGEFPIPVAQSATGVGTTITIEFKEFGVSLAFTPTVLADGLISLEVAPEVSAIDPSVSVRLDNIVVPGLSVRRAHTTIELRDGQAFAIAGLIQSELRNAMNQLPFAGDVPILGALFRSADYQRDETELVIIVTPYLVKPARPTDLAMPTDTFAPASDVDFFLMGKPEAGAPNPAVGKNGQIFGSRTGGGGLDGTIGHIIR